MTVDHTRSMTPWGPPTTPVGIPADVGPTLGFKPPRPPHPTLPLAAGLGALVVLVLSLLASKYVLDLIVHFEWPVAVYVFLLVVIGYGPSIAWWWFASGRWGSGDRLGDVGARPRWTDLAWGPLIWLATILVQTFVGAIVLGFDIPLSNNTDDIGELSADRTYAVAIVVAAVIAAPLVEELVFRGLVMRSLLSKLPAVAAVVLQGLLFGVAHIDPVRGIGNTGLALILSGVGISLGTAAYLLRRIGPTVVAHAIFNGVVMILLLTGIRDRLLEDNPDLFESGSGSVAEQVAVVDQPHVAEPHGRRDPHRTRSSVTGVETADLGQRSSVEHGGVLTLG
jgi:membrane protease YdiL (CAAX protease family)